jgi:hypothetical protein
MSNPFKVIIAILAAITMLATQANAQLNNMTYTFTQVGNDVVITGNGSFNTTGLRPPREGGLEEAFGLMYLNPNTNPFILVSSGSAQTSMIFESFADLSPLQGLFAPNASTVFISTNEATGDFIGISFFGTLAMETPEGYESGNNLSSSMTFKNNTLAAWGLEMGKSATFSYSATDGGDPIGTITLAVAAIPEPSALLLVGSVVGAGWVRRRRR